ncbi:MAG: hypothetical protein GF392_05455 [Candidatus Omnitrophica bacterium]|nr:hypothetical protein [Candidatus Omnitrophota bacterium]
MSQEYVQQDLFEGDYNKKKARKTPIFGNYKGRNLLPFVKVPVEHVIVAVIGVLVMILLSYAAGVEVGRRASSGEETGNETAGREEASAGLEKKLETEALRPVIQTSEKGSGTPAPQIDEKAPDRSLSSRAAEEDKQAPQPVDAEEVEDEDDKRESDSAYIIQIASFRDSTAAEKLVTDLKGRGMSAGYRESGSWYQVYASGYDNIVQARKARAKLITLYADCYIKRER